jgi:plastocyanin
LKVACICLWALLAATVTASSSSSPHEVTVSGRIEVSRGSGNQKPDLSNVVLWLTPTGDHSKAPGATNKRHVQLLQSRKSFSPHVLVVPVGSPVDFPNQDPFFHNVFSLFEGKRFDLGLYEAGSTRTIVFDRPGISYLFCNIHPEMSAVVIALKTPYYAMSDNNGTFSISNVPSGVYELRVWDERVLPDALDALTRRVAISDTSPFLGIIHVTEQRNLSATHKNKYGQDYDTPASNSPIYSRP